MRTIIFPLILLVSGWSNVITSQPVSLDEQESDTKNTYDKVVSFCGIVAQPGSSDEDPYNQVSPASIIYRDSPVFPDMAEIQHIDSTSKITLLVAPQHGTLAPSDKHPNSFIYHANEGYIGMDQMTFEVKLDGKIYKGIYSVYVSETHPANYSGCTEKGPYSEQEGSTDE